MNLMILILIIAVWQEDTVCATSVVVATISVYSYRSTSIFVCTNDMFICTGYVPCDTSFTFKVHLVHLASAESPIGVVYALSCTDDVTAPSNGPIYGKAACLHPAML
jgi:hypothetical protein